MTHSKYFMRKGFKSHSYGSKSALKRTAKDLKESGKIRKYRVVAYDNKYELYVKK